MAIDERALYETLELTYPEENTEQEDTGDAESGDNASANEEGRDAQENGADSRRESGEAEEGGEGQDLEDGEADLEKPGEAEKSQQDKEKRARAAESRRKAQQRRAVEEAIAQERAEEERRWKEFFATAGLKSPVDGKPITTREEYEAYQRAAEERRIRQNLQKGQLLPEDIEAIVRKTIAQQAQNGRFGEDPRKTSEAFAEERGGTRERGEPWQTGGASKADFGPTKGREVTQEQVDAELEEIQRLDPEMVDLKTILESETGEEFRAVVSRGASFLEAFKLANFDRLRQKASAETARRAEQAAMNKARSKDHLQTSRTSGSGNVAVPADVKEMYRYLMPGKTDAEIMEHYNRTLREKKK